MERVMMDDSEKKKERSKERWIKSAERRDLLKMVIQTHRDRRC